MSTDFTERVHDAQAGNAPVLRFGAFEIDQARGEVRKNGARIKLQEKPFQILMHLMERAGQVVTREELRQRVWPADTFVDFDANLNTALNKLRQALGDSADNPIFIQTIPRRGYCFIAPVSPAGQQSAAPEKNPAAAREGAPRTSAQTSRGAHEVETRNALPAARVWRIALAALSVTLLMLAVFGVYSFRPRMASSAKPPSGRFMLLVMPFEDLSAERGQQYFAEGMTEELISELTQFHPRQLGVIARTTAMQTFAAIFAPDLLSAEQTSGNLTVSIHLHRDRRRA